MRLAGAAYSGPMATTAGTPATTALSRAQVAFTLHAYDHDPAAASYGLEAAAALGVEPGRVFKTLLVDTDGRLGVGIVPVDRQLDLKALATALGAKKAVMADPAVAARVTGYVVGGISPIGQKRALPTVRGIPADPRLGGTARPRRGTRPGRPAAPHPGPVCRDRPRPLTWGPSRRRAAVSCCSWRP